MTSQRVHSPGETVDTIPLAILEVSKAYFNFHPKNSVRWADLQFSVSVAGTADEQPQQSRSRRDERIPRDRTGFEHGEEAGVVAEDSATL